MNSITVGTLPLSVFQSQVFVDEATNMTPFAGRKESVNIKDMTVEPPAFVFQHIGEVIPFDVNDRFCKTVVFDHIETVV